MIPHHSGRPWLITNHPRRSVITYISGEVRVALIGTADASEAAIASIVRNRWTAETLKELQTRFAGSYLTIASVRGRVYASGPFAQTRRIFSASVDNLIVLSDRADTLARLDDAPLDEVAITLRLLTGVPYPAVEDSVWRSVVGLDGTKFVVVEQDGTSITIDTWWHRPTSSLSRADGAARVREALEAAVRARSQVSNPVVSDLSGGLDSTPVTYFATRHSDGVIGSTYYTDDPGGREDLLWARRALESMPSLVEHSVRSVDELPDFYGGLTDLRVRLDEPTQVPLTAPRFHAMLENDRAWGAGVHLTGIGGDHLFRGTPQWNNAISRRHPLLAWRRARADDIPEGVKRLDSLVQVFSRRPYRAWYARTVHAGVESEGQFHAPKASDWGLPVVFPRWLTTEAKIAAKDRLLDMAARTEPLGQNPGLHFDLLNIREGARVARGLNQVGYPFDIDLESPLLDDHVIEAVLAVRFEERDSPTEWKPLIKESMRGILPDEYLRRTSKVGGTPQAVRGYAKHFEDVQAIWEESGLLDSGLVDPNELKASSQPSAVSTPSLSLLQLTNTALFLREWNNSKVHEQAPETEMK
nr:asparagine synthase-related protein [Brevibacterium luteolum]